MLETQDVNCAGAIDFVRECRAELPVSANVSQFPKPDILGRVRFAVLNVHPGWMPSYRGSMVYIRVLHNGSDRGGVTVDWIDEGIDTGEMPGRRSFAIREHATRETLLTLTAAIGARLLRRVIGRLQTGQPACRVSQRADEDTGGYYPIPGDREFANYFEQRGFFVPGLIEFRGLRR